MYKLIASDMDETFLNDKHTLVEANIEALKKIRDAGCMFIPSSGRPYPSILESLEPIKDLLEGSYISSLNGGCIHRVGEDEPIFTHLMDNDLVKEIFELGESFGVGIHVYTVEGDIWAKGLTEEEQTWISKFKQYHPIVGDASFVDGRSIAKILFTKEDIDWLLAMEQRLSKKYPQCKITISSNRYLEFNPAGIDKGSSLLELAKLLDIDQLETIAIGDSLNDNDMIKAAGVGLAVANAHPNTKAVADIVLDSTNNDGALKEIYERFICA